MNWKPLWEGVGRRLNHELCEAGTYLFALRLDDGSWDYFVDAIVWDAETPAHWRDDQSGWELEDVTHFCELESP